MGEAFRFDRHSYAAVTDATVMAERIMQFCPASDSEALRLLRSSFPDHPLSMRVAALNLLMRRQSSKTSQDFR